MKLTGKVIFEKTPGRKDAWVKKQVEHDYFLALQITHVDDIAVMNSMQFFGLAWFAISPSILLNQKPINDIFSQPILPPGAKDVPHFTLANFPDFRFDRSVEKDIDPAKVAEALELQDKIISFEISDHEYELVIATKDQSLIDYVKQSDVISFVDGGASIDFTATVGQNRDAVFNIKPGLGIQKSLAELSQQVFGKDFVLWNGAKQPIPYHVTLAQTSQLTKILKEACEEDKKSAATAEKEAPSFGFKS